MTSTFVCRAPARTVEPAGASESDARVSEALPHSATMARPPYASPPGIPLYPTDI